MLVLAVWLSCSGIGDAASDARRPPGRIVYAAQVGEGRSLFVARADGSRPTRITAGPSDFSPRWSPDGRRIAFVRSNGFGATAVWIVNADGTAAEPLDDQHPFAEHPRWSPNGRWIAYQVQTESDESGLRSHTTFELWLVRPDGSERHRLVQGDPTAGGGNPLYSVAAGTWAWSPDGTRIAFVSGQEGQERVRVVDVATGKVRFRGPGWDVDWSPDGRRLAVTVDARFEIGAPACGTLWLVPPDRGKRRVLARPPRSMGVNAPCNLWPRWSLDARSIAFVRSGLETHRRGRLLIARADGRRVVRAIPVAMNRYRWPARCKPLFEYASGYGSGWIVRLHETRRFVPFPVATRATCSPETGEPCKSAGDWHCP
jgi:Tol biopolymer transport system component